MAKRGYLDGAEMATTFNMLRANDLIWSFVINNYLLGKEPFPFDLLYWNSDSTRMPAAMHSFYLRRCYHENALVEPGGSLPRRRADRPAASRPPGLLGLDPRGPYRALEEHLCRDPALSRPAAGSCWPARATSPAWSTRRPPASTATGPTTSCRPTRRTGSRGATHHEGSWWPDWAALERRPLPATRCRPAQPGDGKLPAIEDAPGSYVQRARRLILGGASRCASISAATASSRRAAVAIASASAVLCDTNARGTGRAQPLRARPRLLELVRQHQAREQQHLLLAHAALALDQASTAHWSTNRASCCSSADLARPALQAETAAADHGSRRSRLIRR